MKITLEIGLELTFTPKIRFIHSVCLVNIHVHVFGYIYTRYKNGAYGLSPPPPLFPKLLRTFFEVNPFALC